MPQRSDEATTARLDECAAHWLECQRILKTIVEASQKAVPAEAPVVAEPPAVVKDATEIAGKNDMNSMESGGVELLAKSVLDEVRALRSESKVVNGISTLSMSPGIDPWDTLEWSDDDAEPPVGCRSLSDDKLRKVGVDAAQLATALRTLVSDDSPDANLLARRCFAMRGEARMMDLACVAREVALMRQALCKACSEEMWETRGARFE